MIIEITILIIVIIFWRELSKRDKRIDSIEDDLRVLMGKWKDQN